MAEKKQDSKPEKLEKGQEKERVVLSVERPDDRRVSMNSKRKK